jgi:hypothetical protein
VCPAHMHLLAEHTSAYVSIRELEDADVC